MYIEDFVDYFSPSKYKITESVTTQKFFHTIAVHIKPPIEKLSIDYLKYELLKVEIRLTRAKIN